jgi:hypothetical protein
MRGDQMIRLSLLKMRQFRDSIHQSCMSHNRSRNLYLYLAVIMAHVQGYSKDRESFPSSIDLPADGIGLGNYFSLSEYVLLMHMTPLSKHFH